MCSPRSFYLHLAVLSWRDLCACLPWGLLPFSQSSYEELYHSECIHGVKGTGEVSLSPLLYRCPL